jgi:hypothetical protein
VIGKHLLTIFSDATNRDLDYVKVVGAVAFIAFIALSFYSYCYSGKDFDPVTWSTAVSVLLAATGGVSKIKDYTSSKTTE